MTALCILSAGKTVMLAATAFTLSWNHSVQKTEWRESWQVIPAGLQIVEARIKGSGAGMEPPPEAVLTDGWWVYEPKAQPVPELALAASGATGSGWTLCAAGDCRELGAEAGEPVVLKACSGSSQPR
jgi:hypothetical protein